jgi:hypothetical protein
MLRTILAVLLGYVFIGVLIFCTDQLYAYLVPGFNSMKMPPMWYFELSIATDTLYTWIGGWLCAVISRENRNATWGLIILGELMGVVSTWYLWNQVPHFYSFYLLAIYPPAVWLGAKSRKTVAAV